MRYLSCIVLLLIGGLCCEGVDARAGVVKTVRGTAIIIKNNQSIPCVEGTRLTAGDRIRTAPGATVGLILTDGTRLAVGEGTEVAIQEYVFEPSIETYALIVEIVRGTCVYVSGKIGKMAPGAVTIRTPVGILGTRGTRVAAKVEGGTP